MHLTIFPIDDCDIEFLCLVDRNLRELFRVKRCRPSAPFCQVLGSLGDVTNRTGPGKVGSLYQSCSI